MVDRRSGAACGLTLMFAFAIFWVFLKGIGIWGVNSTIVWGFAIANYVWWIGIGNAGTLISSMLLLTRQKWRASTNRFAEAMTLFAAAIAGLFPIIHLGRPLYFYWLTPYPNTMTIWPQWRSALIWDFWAILSYILFSIVFWYIGLIPDLATLRDRATGTVASAGLRRLCAGLARLGAPLARLRASTTSRSPASACPSSSRCTASSASISPRASCRGGRRRSFPLLRGRRHVLRLRHGGVPRRADALGISRAGAHHGAAFRRDGENHADGRRPSWDFRTRRSGSTAWYGGEHAERSQVAFSFTGPYAPMFWAMLFCNVLVAQSFWFPAVRRSVVAVFVVAVLDQHRDVARAHPDHLEHAVARLSAELVAPLSSDHLGLAHHVRLARPVRSDVPHLRSPDAGRVDARGAKASWPRRCGHERAS